MPTRIKDGDTIAAAQAQSRRSALVSRVNALQKEDIQPFSMDDRQLGSPVHWHDEVTLDGTESTYTYSGSPYNGWATATGWDTIFSLSDDLRLNPPTPLNMSDIAGILVFVDVELITITDEASPPVPQRQWEYMAMFCIQVLRGGSWQVIEKTERYVGAEGNHYSTPTTQYGVYRNVPIRTFIKLSDLTGSGTVTAVRACVACANTHDAATNGLRVVLRHGRMSATALRAGLL
jgi:hypothetical protein